MLCNSTAWCSSHLSDQSTAASPRQEKVFWNYRFQSRRRCSHGHGSDQTTQNWKRQKHAAANELLEVKTRQTARLGDLLKGTSYPRRLAQAVADFARRFTEPAPSGYKAKYKWDHFRNPDAWNRLNGRQDLSYGVRKQPEESRWGASLDMSGTMSVGPRVVLFVAFKSRKRGWGKETKALRLFWPEPCPHGRYNPLFIVL